MTLFALLRFRVEAEADLGWHLAQGRLLFAGHWLRTNALAWTTPDAPWVDSSWLFDLITFISTRIWPEALGPKLVTAIFFAATLLFLGLACREISPLGAWLLPAFALLLAPRATPRPHVASWAALAWVLWLCLRAHRLDDSPDANDHLAAQRDRLLALLPIWIGGQFHPGAAFAAAPLGLFCLEALWHSRATPERFFPRAAKTLLPALLAPVALLAGPAGPASVAHLFRHWNLGEVVQIAEFQHWSWALEPVLPFVAALAILGLLLVRRSKLAQPALFASVLLFTMLALRAVRLVYEDVLVCGPALALLLEQIRLRLEQRPARLALILLTALAMLPHRIPAQLGAVRFDPRWDEHTLPVRAAKFLDAHSLAGQGFNGLRAGGYLAWARPSVPIFIDARIHAYPPQLWRELETAENSSAQFDGFLRDRGVEWALTTRLRERLGGYRELDNQPGWALVYWDDLSAIYLRRDLARLAPLLESLEYKLFHPWGNLLAAIPKLAPAQLSALDAEVRRYLETSPGDATAFLIECASAHAQSRVDAEAICDAAERLAEEQQNAPLLALVRKVRAQK